MPRPRPWLKPSALALVALMAVGSVTLWLGIPLFWVWLASQITKTSQPTLGPYLMVLVGIPVSMVVVGKLLAKLNHVYGQVTGTAPRVRVQLPWLRSMRGERPHEQRHVGELSALEKILVVAVVIAIAAFEIWFFFYSGSPIDQRNGRDPTGSAVVRW